MHTTTKSMTRGLLGALVALTLGACGGTVEVKGRVTNDAGQQQQGLAAAGTPALGGSGTVEAATQVKAYTVAAGGSLSVVAEAEVQADHSYSLQLPQGTERVVIQAVDAQGQVVASALLDAAVTAQGQAARTAPAMSSESSLEAEVFVKMVADGAAPSTVDTVDLRSRIDLDVALEARKEAADAQAKTIAALAAAVRSAQDSEVKAYADAGVTVTQEQLFQASLEASAKLDATLDASTANAAQAYADFFAAIQQETEETSEEQEAEAERASSASFRAVIDARLSASADTSVVATEAIRSASLLEARANNAAVQAVLKAAGAADATLTKATNAYVTLSNSLASSGTSTAQAWAAYSAALTANSQTSVLGDFLQVGVSGNASLNAAASASATAAGTLQNAVAATVELNAALLGTLNLTGLTQGVVSAYGTYHDAVRAQAETLATFSAKAAPAVEVLVVANGHVEI